MRKENELRAMLDMAQRELQYLSEMKALRALFDSSGNTLAELGERMAQSINDPEIKYYQTIIFTLKMALDI
jgi:hypothetical protein